jgi:hypothetical protein
MSKRIAETAFVPLPLLVFLKDELGSRKTDFQVDCLGESWLGVP